MVGIADPERRHPRLPASVSGGMRAACDDRDGARVQSPRTHRRRADHRARRHDPGAILELIRELQGRLGLAVILVTHDLGIVAQYADDVTILYAARMMEQAPMAELFAHPMSPYTKGLLGSMSGDRRLASSPTDGNSWIYPGPLIRLRDAGSIRDARSRLTIAHGSNRRSNAKRPTTMPACIRV